MTTSAPGVGRPLSRPDAVSATNGFIAVGDIMLGDSAPCVGFGFHSRYPRDASPAFSALSPVLKRGEIVLGNLECVLTRTGSGSTRYQSDQMRGDPEYASNLSMAGFTAMSVANNHATQHGIAAFASTVEFLEGAGIRCVGLRGKGEWCAEPVVQTTRKGLRVGMLGYSWRPRQYDGSEPPYAEGDVEAVVRDVTRLRLSTDAVVVSLHWGEEFLNLPSAEEVASARRIIDAGASVIVGHHPHVVRPAERYNGGIICYSLGNFVTDMIWQPALCEGAVLECELSRHGLSRVELAATRVDGEFRARPDTRMSAIDNVPVSGIGEPEYRSRVSRSVRRQRLAVYAYAARNVGRYSPAILGELVATTLRNKVSRRGQAVGVRRHDGKQKKLDHIGSNAQRGRLSILHVVAPARFGGLESVVRLLAAGLLDRGHSVTVAAVLSKSDELPHPFVQALEAAGVRTIAIRLGDRDYRGEKSAIRSLCREYSPDVVHTHGFRSDVINGGVARSEKIAVVSTCHGFIDSDWRGRLYQWLQRRALRRFDAAIVVSAPIQARLRAAHVPEAKIHLVPNCFSPGTDRLTRADARHALRLPDAPVIGWVGRLTREKGADIALEAFARLGHRTARLAIVGEGSEERALRSLAVKLGVDERVHWCGAIPDASKVFTAFDVFLLSSRTEGTPIALFEAMAAGVPIVATRVGGVPDVVNSLSAILVDGEDVEGITRGLTEVFRDAASARVRAVRARERVLGDFDSERWLERYESIYYGVMRPRAQRVASTT